MYLCTTRLILFQIPSLEGPYKWSQIWPPLLSTEASGLEVNRSNVPDHSHPLPAHLPDPEQPHLVPWRSPLLVPEDGGQATSLDLRVAKSAHPNVVQESLFCALLTAGIYPFSYYIVNSISP